MAANNTDHLSALEEILAICPRFRIVVAGNTGIGKSSLIKEVFNLDPDAIDIAHDRPGKADINRGYTSLTNPRFELHDSQGFESGNAENWEIVKKYLETRGPEPRELRDQVHAIWLCIETPREGGRELQDGDEKLMAIAKKSMIPLIVIFTKFDLLVNEYFQKPQVEQLAEAQKLAEALRLAQNDLETRINNFQAQNKGVTCTWTSNDPELPNMLGELTNVTQNKIREELIPLWVITQQIDAQKKVDECIREGCKTYWPNLRDGAFRGRQLEVCLMRIYRDIVGVWNFNDIDELLFAREFIAKTRELVEEFLPLPDPGTGDEQPSVAGSDTTSGGGATGTVGYIAKVFDLIIETIPSVVQYLGAYIINLILVLRHIFIATRQSLGPPRKLSKDLLDGEIQKYKDSEASLVNRRIRKMDVGSAGFERKIADLIQTRVNFNAKR